MGGSGGLTVLVYAIFGRVVSEVEVDGENNMTIQRDGSHIY